MASLLDNQTRVSVGTFFPQLGGGGGGGGANPVVSTITAVSVLTSSIQGVGSPSTILNMSGQDSINLFTPSVNILQAGGGGSVLNVSSINVSSINGSSPGGGGSTVTFPISTNITSATNVGLASVPVTAGQIYQYIIPVQTFSSISAPGGTDRLFILANSQTVWSGLETVNNGSEFDITFVQAGGSSNTLIETNTTGAGVYLQLGNLSNCYAVPL